MLPAYQKSGKRSIKKLLLSSFKYSACIIKSTVQANITLLILEMVKIFEETGNPSQVLNYLFNFRHLFLKLILKLICSSLLLFCYSISSGQNASYDSINLLTDELPFQVFITDEGNIFISGRISNSNNEDCYLASHDPLGNLLWSRLTGGIYFDHFQKSVKINNGIICGGNSNSFGNSQDFFLVKFNENGDTVFTKILGGNKYDKLIDLVPDDEGFLLGGYSNSFGAPTDNDIVLINIDSSGNPLWAKSLGSVNDETLHSISKTPDHGTVICGSTNSFGAGLKDVFILKTDSSGSLTWLKCIGASDEEEALDATVINNNIYVTGYTKSVNGGQDVWIIKSDMSGTIIWNKVIDFGLNEKGNKIFYRNGKLFISGYLQSFTGTYDDMFILSADETGSDFSALQFELSGQQYGNFIREINGKLLTAGYFTDSAKVKIFELDDSLNSCYGSIVSFDTSSLQALITDTVFNVNVISPDSVINDNGGNYADAGIAYVNPDLCFLPLTNDYKVENSKDALKIYPNPCYGDFSISFTNPGFYLSNTGAPCRIQIFNTTGASIVSCIIQPNELNNANGYKIRLQQSPGIYLLKISSEEFYRTEKIIIQDF